MSALFPRHVPQDEGSPPLSASLNVSVRVNPVPPTFGQQVYEADLMEFTDKVRHPGLEEGDIHSPL